MSHIDTLLLDGSEVREVVWSGHDVRVTFSAAFVRRALRTHDSATAGSLDAAHGYLKPLVLHFSGVDTAAPVDAADWVGALSGGEVRQGTQVWRALPLPFSLDGPLSLTLCFQSRAERTVTAQSLRLQVAPDSRFIESYAC